ncbi:MATE family efflux transporter [Streptomyces sp. NPDC059352]|uniref:MATE family efflux transporter n=1 Tax=Streptomyces sp. NPDC059352 TaxID=3346810 RepID=UPI0036CE91DB
MRGDPRVGRTDQSRAFLLDVKSIKKKRETPEAAPAEAEDAVGRMATRPVGRLLWENCVQTIASVGMFGLYALTNAWFVGHGVGDQAMAAVNLVAPLLLLLGAVATTVGAGGATLVSRALGAGDEPAAGRAAGNAFTLFWVTAAVTTVAGLVFIDPFLDMLGARGPLHEYARQYAVILLCGSLAYTGFSSLVRAEGRVGFSTRMWIGAIVVQIILDPLLIFGFDLGVSGAALGTVGGQTVSAVMSWWFFFLQRERPYRVRLADLRPHAATLRTLVGIGLPSFLANIGLTVLAVLVNDTLAVTGGAIALIAYAVCSRLQTFAVMPHTGISQGLQPIVGYNAGRGLTARVARTRTLALCASLVYGAATAILLTVLAKPLVGIFVSGGEAADEARFALYFIAVGGIVTGIAPLTAAYFQALGRPLPAYILTIGTLLVLKAPLVVAFGHIWGAHGVWFGLAAGEFATAAAALLLLHRADRRTPTVAGTP